MRLPFSIIGEFMVATNQEYDLFGYGATIRHKSKDGSCYSFPEADGEVSMQLYPVFPGIALVYENVHSHHCTFHRSISNHVFEIHHCREGRIEGTSHDELFYVGPGDLSISKPRNGDYTMHYPLHHYHGITVIIDVKKAPPCLSCFLEDVEVQPESLMHKFCDTSGVFIARSMPSIAHVFEELYSVPESIRTGYLKVKVLELMLFLSSIDVQTDEYSNRCFSHNQKLLAKNVSDYLMEHMDQKVTLEQLSDLFHISGTQIKASIKGVFGISLYSLIRIQKMQSAAKMLQNTNLTILEIAGLHGYDNASKFAGAFKAVMGVSPKEYRNAPIQVENVFT